MPAAAYRIHEDTVPVGPPERKKWWRNFAADG